MNLLTLRHGVTVPISLFCLSVAVGLGLPAHRAAGGPPFSFQEVAGEVGVGMTFTPPANYMAGLAFMIGGGAVGDFNNDGWQDLFVVSGGSVPDYLFINNGDGTFTDRAAQWGLTDLHMGAGAAVGDYNADGWLDLYVTSYGDAAAPMTTGAHRLYRNNGNGTFSDVAALAGVNYTDSTPNAFCAAFGDIDLDGDLDLFVTGWFTGAASSGGNRLFRNNGDETFTDITVQAGVFDIAVHGFAVRFADMDGDRYPELLLAGDFVTSRYYVNNGDGTFTDTTAQSGTGLDCNGMGSVTGDFNRDGLLDWYVTNIYRGETHPEDPCGNMLYMNQGNHVFIEQAAAAGVNDGNWGWGTVALDVNHDGKTDLIEVNGFMDDDIHPDQYSNQPARVWVNNGDDTFDEVAAQCGFDHTGQGRGLVNLDYDNNGTQDVVVLSSDGDPLAFYDATVATPGNWLRIFLETQAVPGLAPNGFGARIRLTVEGSHDYRTIDGGSNYLSHSELSAHFGLADAATVDEVRVEWADGTTTVLADIEANQTLTISALAGDSQLGDMNCDSAVTPEDVPLFATALVDPSSLWAQQPYCGLNRADINQDTRINGVDIAQFISILVP